jgi:hypothetical protein
MDLGAEDKLIGSKITQILEETRVVIPGTEIFLAFQLGAIFTEVFQRLPFAFKMVHIISFVMMVIAVILLLSSAPYHRICAGGHNDERVLRYANRMLLSSMFVTATGICLEMWLVCAIAISARWAWYIAPAVWGVAMILWFMVPYCRRQC